ncbi:13900_t:CDS:2 [Entrophospora sp. SA101]|nr:13900_t:CDS:2 [Entrophospora sp. SA101]
MSSVSETSKVTTETNENELSAEERSVLIKEVIELQEGLKALIQKVEAVKDDHNQIQSGNQILQTYINNLMASNVLSKIIVMGVEAIYIVDYNNMLTTINRTR